MTNQIGERLTRNKMALNLKDRRGAACGRSVGRRGGGGGGVLHYTTTRLGDLLDRSPGNSVVAYL